MAGNSMSGRKKVALDLPEGWQGQFLDLYSQGASDVEIKSLIHDMRGTFSAALWARWLVEEPLFADTIKLGRSKSHAWWELHGRANLYNKEYNSTLWYMNMKNRFGWRDRQDITSDDKPVSQQPTVIVSDGKTRDLLEKMRGD